MSSDTDNVIRKNHPNEVLKSAISSGATLKIVTLSIIFDETVEIFNVSSDEAREIIEFAQNSKVVNVVSSKKPLLVKTQSRDISVARRNSLLRFLEKRKERLCGGLEFDMKIVLLTIGCNGKAVNFNVSSDKAKDILKFAESLKTKNVIPPKKELYVETLSGDLPLVRSNSLLRFSENKKTRLDCGSKNGIIIAPLTISYDGTIVSFDVFSDEVANILEFAERLKFRDAVSFEKQSFVETLSGAQHLARRNSMLGFSEKEKERVCGGSKNYMKIALLTICYNEMAASFHVSSDKANDILRFAERSKIKNDFSSNYGDLPLARSISLPRFSEKSKTRLDYGSKNGTKNFPMNFSYDGKTANLNVSMDKAANILAFAERSKFNDAFPSGKKIYVETLTRDQHLARRNSMLGVSEKQKERLCAGSENGLRIAPLTICYNGLVAKFNVSNDKANEILKFAKMSITNDVSSSNSGDLPLPKINSSLRLDRESENGIKVAPLSIFYDGKIAVYDVSIEKAANILNFVERDACSSKKEFSVGPLSGDLDLARKNFMLGILVNRKERSCPSRYGAIKIAPLCIFYNEKVAVFDVRSDKVDGILKFAESSKQHLVVKTLSEDVQLATSSIRFLEKRQERMTMVSPYGFPHAAPENKK